MTSTNSSQAATHGELLLLAAVTLGAALILLVVTPEVHGAVAAMMLSVELAAAVVMRLVACK